MRVVVTIFGARHRVSEADAVVLQQALLGNGMTARAVSILLDGKPAFFNSDAVAWIGDDPDEPDVPTP